MIVNYVEHDARKSVAAFKKFTVSAIRTFFGEDATIHSFEDSANPLERELDRKHGVDGVITDGDGWTHNYASRVTFKPQYQNFTVRGYRPSGTKTEIDKIGQVDEPKPEFHIHTCVGSDGRGALVAIDETVELYQYIERYKPGMRYNRQDGVGFYPVDFKPLANVKIYHVDASGNAEEITAKFKAA